MRTSVLLAACAAVAIASPVPDEVIVTHTDVDFVTKIVTVTAGVPVAEASAPAATPVVSSSQRGWFRKHRKTRTKTYAPAPTTTVVPVEPSTYTPAPTPAPSTSETAPAPTSEAPAPPPSSSAPAPPPSYTSKAPAPPPSSSQQAPAPSGTATTYKDAVVLHHNLARQRHNAAALTWSEEMASSAQSIASTCRYAHKMDEISTPYGQNLAAGKAPGDVSDIITDMFYASEEPYFASYYGKTDVPTSDHNIFGKFGHFTQVVWKGTTSVGCATAKCGSSLVSQDDSGNWVPMDLGGDGSNWYTVCNYHTPGNYAGEFASNVDSPNTPTYSITGASDCDKKAIQASWDANQNAGTY